MRQKQPTTQSMIEKAFNPKPVKKRIIPDFQSKRLIRINAKTEIYIGRDENEDQAREKFIQKWEENHKLKFVL